MLHLSDSVAMAGKTMIAPQKVAIKWEQVAVKNI
ncbi:hypothetical protein ABIC60_002145 [Phyllobacterium ifriqiyense]